MSLKELRNKVVVITGAAKGIGFEIADNYLKQEVKAIIVVDIDELEGQQSVKKLNSKYRGEKACFYKGDVTNENDLNRIFEEVLSTYNYIDVLVNNAGVSDQLWKKCIDVNVSALIGWSLKFWEHMRRDKGGKGGTIVNLSSIYGYTIDPYAPVYQASKFAVMAFTKSLGHTYNYDNYGVRVIAICPGFTETNLTSEENLKTAVEQNKKEDFMKLLKSCKWQKADAVGRAAVEIFEKADSGTAWSIQGNEPIQQVP